MTDVDMRLTFSWVECCICGVLIGLPDNYTRGRKEDKDPWYCPNGHRQSFVGTPLSTQLEEVKDSRDRIEGERDEAQEKLARKIRQIARLKEKVERVK
jgi:hypothetical protein